MGDLGEYLQQVRDKLNVLLGDVSRIKFNEESPPEKKKDMKSLQKVTHLRKDLNDAKDAAENPDLTFISDMIGDAFDN